MKKENVISLVNKQNKIINDKKILVSRDEIEKKTFELCEMLKCFDGETSEAAHYICFQVVSQSACSHFEGVGILAETLLSWRETSLECSCEESEAD
jgi:hypothetical protein